MFRMKADPRIESSSCGREADYYPHWYLLLFSSPFPPKKSYQMTGLEYNGVTFQGKICGVSIMRAGESMEQGLRDCCRSPPIPQSLIKQPPVRLAITSSELPAIMPTCLVQHIFLKSPESNCRSVRIGKILIQRDEQTALPKLFYEKLPHDIKDRYVLLLDPMLATGGSAITAVKVLLSKGTYPFAVFLLSVLAFCVLYVTLPVVLFVPFMLIVAVPLLAFYIPFPLFTTLPFLLPCLPHRYPFPTPHHFLLSYPLSTYPLTITIHPELTTGIPESRILFLNLICAPEGIAAFKEEFPELRIVTAFVDQGLDSRKYVSPLSLFIPDSFS
jgi:uracil phosphoribosyltransferase